MGFICHGWCTRFKLKPKKLGDKKYCSICCLNFRTRELLCPCCSVKLRVKARYKSKTGPRLSYPELDRNRKENHRKLEEFLRAKTKANADKMLAALRDAFSLTPRQLSFLTELSVGQINNVLYRHPEMFGVTKPRLGHKNERRVWLQTGFIKVACDNLIVDAA